ncbi:MAG: TlpA family protein disulfide reductase [Candidatus Rokubacteria bacterium]|nr:TlpA family protein disulfide reductase [Candidatus Rokubacteria bacterium]
MREAPAKAALHREFQSRGLQVIGVSLGEDADSVQEFARKLNIPFPLLLDEEGRSGRLFGLWGHPNTVLIDRAGRVIGLVRGERDWQSEGPNIHHMMEAARIRRLEPAR